MRLIAGIVAVLAILLLAPGAQADPVPVGTTAPYGGASDPAGWLIADGRSLLTITYPELFAEIGYTYGGGGASFNIPDMRQRFPLGKAAAGTGSTLGSTGGQIDHGHTYNHTNTIASESLTTSTNGAHYHSFTTPFYAWEEAGAANMATAGVLYNTSVSGDHSHTITSDHGGATAATSPTIGTANPPFQTFNYIIKATSGSATPCGATWGWTGAAAPANSLLANGAAINRTTEAYLFGCLATTYGVGDGSTTFNLPDLRQRFALGKAAAGTGSTLGGTGGTIDTTHTVQDHTHTVFNEANNTTSATPAHNHGLNVTTNFLGQGGGCGGCDSVLAPGLYGTSFDGGHSHSVPTHAHTAGSTSGLTTNAANPPFQSVTNYLRQTAGNPAVGTVSAFAGATLPAGWKWADGGALNMTWYPELYATTLETFGNGGDGAGGALFSKPDMRQRFPLGKAAAGTGSTLGGTGGAIDHTHTASHSHALSMTASYATDNNPDHTHTFGTTCCDITLTGGPNQSTWSLGLNTTTAITAWNDPVHGMYHDVPGNGQPGDDDPSGAAGHNHGGATGTNSAATSANNPPYLALNYIVAVDLTPPDTAPTLVSPANAANVTASPALTATYADPATATYGALDFQVCSDAACSTVETSGTSATGIAPGANGNWTPGTLVGGIHWWRARNHDGGDNTGPWSTTRWFKLNNAPAAPTIVRPTANAWVTSLKPTLVAQFSDSDIGATGSLTFEVCTTNAVSPWSTNCPSGYQTGSQGGGLISGAIGSWAPSSNLTEGQQYYWRVQATDNENTVSAWSNPVLYFQPDTVAPNAVTDTTSASPATDQPILTWTTVTDPAPASGVAYYRVYRSIVAGGLGEQVNADGATTGGTFTETGLGSPGNYYYTVRAVDVAGNEQLSGNNQFTFTFSGYLYLRNTAGPATGSWNLLPTSPGVNDWTTAVKVGSVGANVYSQFTPGAMNGTAVGSLPNTPNGKGWIDANSPNKSYGAGNWKVRTTTNIPICAKCLDGPAYLDMRFWRVTLSGGSITSSTALSGWQGDVIPMAPLNGIEDHAIDIALPSFTLASNEYLYIEYWAHMTGDFGMEYDFSVGNTTQRIEPPATVAPSLQYTADANAQAGTGNANAITSSTPHFSWKNNQGVSIDSQRTQVVNTLLQNVAALWHLDSSGTANDSSGNGQSLSLVGSPTTPSAQTGFSESLGLNGSSQYAQTAVSSAFDLDAFTVDAWFKTSVNDATSRTIAVKRIVGQSNFDLTVQNGLVRAEVTTASGANTYTLTSTGTVSDGNWHHVAFVVNATPKAYLYLDGVLDTTATMVGNVDNPSTNVRIGVNEWGSQFFNGQIDEMRISNVARSSAQIAGYYNSRLPHATTLWDSDATDTGVAIASCATGTRCADIVYAGTTLRKVNARYYARAKYKNGGTWGSWSDYDWFETALPGPLTMTLGVDYSSRSLGSILPGTNATASSSLTVTTNSPTGYTLTAPDQNDWWGAIASPYTIPDWTGTGAAPTAWAAGTGGYWGLTVRQATGGRMAKWGAGGGPYPESDYTNNLYAGLDATVPSILHQTTGPAAPDTIITTYRTQATNAQRPGAYSSSILYTATANP